MGHGIAQVAAAAGARVHLFDSMTGAAAAGIARIAKNLDKAVELGKVSSVDREATLARVSPFDDLRKACFDADFVIEAAP